MTDNATGQHNNSVRLLHAKCDDTHKGASSSSKFQVLCNRQQQLLHKSNISPSSTLTYTVAQQAIQVCQCQAQLAICHVTIIHAISQGLCAFACLHQLFQDAHIRKLHNFAVGATPNNPSPMTHLHNTIAMHHNSALVTRQLAVTAHSLTSC